MFPDPGRPRPSAVASTAALLLLAACAAGGAAAGAADDAVAPTPTEAPPAPVVQVRDFAGAAFVTVVAWSPEHPTYGLRAHVNATGEVVGGIRQGDHWLYVGDTHVQGMGGFRHVRVVPVPPGPVLLHVGPQSDPRACEGGDRCAPQRAVMVQMPDDLLRGRRDSLVVTFAGGRYADWTVTLGADLIATYLRAVDSVAAARAP